jgi:hypothetical protein
MIELENISDVAAAPLGELAPGEGGNVIAVDHQRAAGWRVNAGEQIQQGGFSRTGRPHEGEKLTALDG